MSVSFNAGVIIDYSKDNWYEYVINTFIVDPKKLKEIFPDKKEITAEDVVKYIITSEYGAVSFILTLKSIARILNLIEKKIIEGKWEFDDGIKISKSLSTYVTLNSDSIEKSGVLMEFLDTLYDDLYESYFQWVDPDMEQNKPKIDSKYNINMPENYYRKININDTKTIVKMLKSIIPYLNVLEHMHKDFRKLFHYEILLPLEKVLDKLN